MNKEFVLVDRLNSVAFQCFSLVKFRFNNIDYLVYYSYEGVNNCKVFTSRIIANGNNSYSLSELSNEEKNMIFHIIYAIVITLPSSYSKDLDISKIVNEFAMSNNIIFSKDIPSFGEQKLSNNSFFASSNADYLTFVRSFYNYVIPKVLVSTRSNLVWSIPSSNGDTSINRLDDNLDSRTTGNSVNNNMDLIIPISGAEASSASNVNNEVGTYSFTDFGFNYVPTDQEDTLINKKNNNRLTEEKNAGFASNRYIIIGTICLILASVVVAVAIIVTKNLH